MTIAKVPHPSFLIKYSEEIEKGSYDRL